MWAGVKVGVGTSGRDVASSESQIPTEALRGLCEEANVTWTEPTGLIL